MKAVADIFLKTFFPRYICLYKYIFNMHKCLYVIFNIQYKYILIKKI